MQAVDKREHEMSLQENYFKLQQAHEYLIGEQRQLSREKEGLQKKYDKLKAQAKKDAELAATRNASLEMKASQIPVLEREVAKLKAQNATLGDKVSELALLESEAGPKALRQYLASYEHREELKQERETFMRRKIHEWAEAGWLEVQKMMVEAAQKAETEKAALVASTSHEASSVSWGDGSTSEDEEGEPAGLKKGGKAATGEGTSGAVEEEHEEQEEAALLIKLILRRR